VALTFVIKIEGKKNYYVNILYYTSYGAQALTAVITNLNSVWPLLVQVRSCLY